MIRFTIPLTPTAKITAKHGTVRRKDGRSVPVTYKSPEQTRNEEQLMGLLERHVPSKPMTGAVLLSVTAYLPVPQSKPQWWRKAALEGFYHPITKPDCSNLLKNIEDCMTKMGFFRDDSLIVDVSIMKQYSEKPRWEITLIETPQPKTRKEYNELRGQ